MPRFDVLFQNFTKSTEFRTDDANLEEIEACLLQTRYDSCYFRIEYFFQGESKNITLSSENGEYYLLYSDTRDEDEDGDMIIKNYYHPNRSLEKKIEFGGEFLSDKVICDDFNIVKEIFRQFIDEDRVSEDLMS